MLEDLVVERKQAERLEVALAVDRLMGFWRSSWVMRLVLCSMVVYHGPLPTFW